MNPCGQTFITWLSVMQGNRFNDLEGHFSCVPTTYKHRPLLVTQPGLLATDSL